MEWTNQPLYRTPPPIADQESNYQLLPLAERIGTPHGYAERLIGVGRRQHGEAMPPVIVGDRSLSRCGVAFQVLGDLLRTIVGETLFHQGRHAR